MYPPELINEKFLINVRNCIVKLSDNHPVKIWLKSYASPEKPNPKEQQDIDFLNEILNTQFNLLTDPKVKNKVIHLLTIVPEHSFLERLLKSYLYLMIGNITRSDRILRAMVIEPPRLFFQGLVPHPSLYHKMMMVNLEKVLRKFSRHPADRLSFYLYDRYLRSFSNKTDLIELLEEIEPSGMQGKMGLSYTERNAPAFVGYLRLSQMSEKRLIKNLRSGKYSSVMQSLWVWPFIDVEPLISESMAQEVKILDEKDPLWALYLLDNEKLADLYFKKGGTPISRRRSFLRQHLDVPEDFMLTLYKLIEIGDIDQELVKKVSKHLQKDE